MWVKALVVILLLVIVVSLFSALYTLVKGTDNGARTAKFLTYRIALSVVLFVVLMAAMWSGTMRPHGVNPNAVEPVVKGE